VAHAQSPLGAEVVEQEVYGAGHPFTHNLVLDTMPVMPPMVTDDAHAFIEDVSGGWGKPSSFFRG